MRNSTPSGPSPDPTQQQDPVEAKPKEPWHKKLWHREPPGPTSSPTREQDSVDAKPKNPPSPPPSPTRQQDPVEAETKKPWHKEWWARALAAVALVGIGVFIGMLIGRGGSAKEYEGELLATVDVNGMTISEACGALRDGGWRIDSVYGSNNPEEESDCSDETRRVARTTFRNLDDEQHPGTVVVLFANEPKPEDPADEELGIEAPAATEEVPVAPEDAALAEDDEDGSVPQMIVAKQFAPGATAAEPLSAGLSTVKLAHQTADLYWGWREAGATFGTMTETAARVAPLTDSGLDTYAVSEIIAEENAPPYVAALLPTNWSNRTDATELRAATIAANVTSLSSVVTRSGSLTEQDFAQTEMRDVEEVGAEQGKRVIKFTTTSRYPGQPESFDLDWTFTFDTSDGTARLIGVEAL